VPSQNNENKFQFNNIFMPQNFSMQQKTSQVPADERKHKQMNGSDRIHEAVLLNPEV
jgi:hypothetical protein